MIKTINLDALPEEIRLMILLRTDLPTFLSFIQTCQRMKNLEDELFWKYKYQLDFGSNRLVLPLMNKRPNVPEAMAEMKLINTEQPWVYKRDTGVPIFGCQYQKFLEDFPKNWKPEKWKQRYRRIVLSKRHNYQIVMTSHRYGYLSSNCTINLHHYRRFYKIESLPRTISLSLGGTKNYAVAEDGQCYIWRDGSSLESLGSGLSSLYNDIDFDENFYRPKLIPGLHGIIKIVGGMNSISGFITDDYSIYLSNYKYYSTFFRQIYLTPPEILPIKAIDFDVGWGIRGVIGIDKKVYLCVPRSTRFKMTSSESPKLKKIVWESGYLMNLYRVVFSVPCTSDLDLKFKQVIIGNSEIVVLSLDGDIYRIKHDHEMIKEKPLNNLPVPITDCSSIINLNPIRKVKFPTDTKFSQISGNFGNYSALTRDGNVYVWGDNLEKIFNLAELDDSLSEIRPAKKLPETSTRGTTGKLGHSGDFDDDEMNSFLPNDPNRIIFDQPTLVNSLSNLSIKSISISSAYLAIFTEKEKLIIKGETVSVPAFSSDYDDYERSLFDDSCASE